MFVCVLCVNVRSCCVVSATASCVRLPAAVVLNHSRLQVNDDELRATDPSIKEEATRISYRWPVDARVHGITNEQPSSPPPQQQQQQPVVSCDNTPKLLGSNSSKSRWVAAVG